MKKLRDWPLSLQIWIVFTLVIVIIFVLLSVYFSLTIRSFFTDETYKTIEMAQKNFVQKAAGIDFQEENVQVAANNDIREVKSIRLNYTNNAANLTKIEKFIQNKESAALFMRKLSNQAKNQDNITQRYVQRVSTGRILYVIRINGSSKGNYIVSYMWDNYRNALASNLMWKLFPVMIIALVISLIAAKYLSQRLVVPLRDLKNKVKKIGKKQWDENIKIDRNDEIGELSKSIEEMRMELAMQDEYEQTMLQQASHDLKTPLMVIRSYVKALEDGIYPKGDLASTMKVIDSEAESMQKRIKNLIYLTKIKYMSKHPGELKKINVKGLLEQIIDNYTFNERKIDFEMNIEDIEIKGDEEQWTVVFENIIENGLRFAKSIITVSAYQDSKLQYITIYNDGEKIPDTTLESMFEVFNKGNKGNFGLGLDISKRIVNMYSGSIKAQNEKIGVSFTITLKKE